ncbi:hypothetical protein [Shimia thalassica]|uniref:hypothetical protein n=1 Tax=Shimia thalassica TaxID=1715693 RepID=UPI002495944E|nr:hypothetical protein [Shimia thalassica]
MNKKSKWLVGIAFGLALLFAWVQFTKPNRIPDGIEKAEAVRAIDHVAKALRGNMFGLESSDLHIVANPKGAGLFVFVPQTRHAGAERLFIWFSNNRLLASLNGPSFTATPSLAFPKD